MQIFEEWSVGKGVREWTFQLIVVQFQILNQVVGIPCVGNITSQAIVVQIEYS
jgi:hypothetical protein